MRRLAAAFVITAATAACSAPDDPSPLILNGANGALGLRALSTSQSNDLLQSIVATGAPCTSIERTYLQAIDPEVGTELWNVRCADGAYRVEVPRDSRSRRVASCGTVSPSDALCFEPPKREHPRQLPTDLKEIMAGREAKQ